MTSKNKTLFAGTFWLAFVLVISVPFCDLLLSLFFSGSGQPDSLRQILAGIGSETLRALITCYLYSVTENRGQSLAHGIKLGLLYSALIGSLYLILGALYFQLKNPVRFLIADSFILLVQGLTSGLVLYYVFREKRK